MHTKRMSVSIARAVGRKKFYEWPARLYLDDTTTRDDMCGDMTFLVSGLLNFLYPLPTWGSCLDGKKILVQPHTGPSVRQWTIAMTSAQEP